MVFKDLSFLVLWMKVALVLEGLCINSLINWRVVVLKLLNNIYLVSSDQKDGVVWNYRPEIVNLSIPVAPRKGSPICFPIYLYLFDRHISESILEEKLSKTQPITDELK